MAIRVVGPDSPMPGAAATRRLWPYGDPGSEGGAPAAGLGLIRMRQQPFHLRPMAGTQGTPTGKFYRAPYRLSDGSSTLAEINGGNRGLGSVLAAPVGPAVPVTEMRGPREIPSGPHLKVGPLPPLPLGRFVDGGTIFTITPSMVAHAKGPGPCSTDPSQTCSGMPLPGPLGAAARIYSEVIVRIALLSDDKCNILAGMVSHAICRESYRGFGPWRITREAAENSGGELREGPLRIFPGMFSGKVPLFRFKHPNTGDQDWGIYCDVDAPDDAPRGAWKRMKFVVRKISKSWWSRMWDWIKEFVVKLIRFLGDFIRELVQGLCSQAQGLFNRVADAQDGKSTLSSDDTFTLQQAGLSPNQVNMLLSSNPEAAAISVAVQAATRSICKLVDDTGKPPPIPKPEGGGGGIIIAAGIGAGLLFLFLR